MAKRRVTSRDVAKRAGVSRTTVSFVLNDVTGVNISQETRQRVLQAAQELGYVPDAAARSLASRRAYTLGLVLVRNQSHIAADAFLPQVIHGLTDSTRQAGFHLLLEPVEDVRHPDAYIHLVRAKHIDGIVLSGPRSDDEQLPVLVNEGFPVVLLGQLPGNPACFVDVDNRSAAREAVEHLIQLGHQCIGCITNAPLQYTGSADRLAGYRDALQSAGIPYQERLVRYGDFVPESGYQAACSLLRETPPPTALFVASDVVAFGAMAAIREYGLSIPDDVALVGFDDVPLARYMDPPLTTVRLPATELGSQAGQMIIKLIQDGEVGVRNVILETELIVRASCGAQSDYVS
ncbi:MAG: LacI family DNA-binding transcriptional regulator [Anaerolineae bacterium]